MKRHQHYQNIHLYLSVGVLAVLAIIYIVYSIPEVEMIAFPGKTPYLLRSYSLSTEERALKQLSLEDPYLRKMQSGGDREEIKKSLGDSTLQAAAPLSEDQLQGKKDSFKK